MQRLIGGLVSLAFCLLMPTSHVDLLAAEVAAASYRKAGELVAPQPDDSIVCEAEEFHVESPGWEAKPWGTNYYAATFANCFLSRKAYLGAPEQADGSTASLSVQVPKAGKYMVLVRYEAVYRFETQFTVRIEQPGRAKYEKLFGARDNLKIWAFRQKLQKEVGWPWGAVENVVWEGYPTDLAAGAAKISLVAGKQSGDTARRNVDLVLLTPDLDGVEKRIQTENYLPLDGLLTQAGDVYVKVHNTGSSPVTVTVPYCTEHSPYWVHQRTWKPIAIKAEAGQSSDWTEVGSNLDSLNDGQWNLTAAGDGKTPPNFALEFGVRDAAGQIATIKRFDQLGARVKLAYDADTRYSRRIRSGDDVLTDLVNYLKQHPVQGKAPQRTLVYGYSFDPEPANAQWTANFAEFAKLIGANGLNQGSAAAISPAGPPIGYVDLRGQDPAKLAASCAQFKTEGKADKIAVVSLGDEIGLVPPPANDQSGFRDWLKSRGVKPADIDPAAGSDWEKINYSPKPETATANPALYYFSKIYSFRYGIAQQKKLTDVLRASVPNAGIGANFSPHHGHLYLGPTYQWISLFREQGMTMPWGEDYIWQVPVGSQQMNFLMVDMFRSGIKNHPAAKIHYYVMPHTPGNTTSSWRRQFYGTLAHGAKVLNLFEFRPVQAAYTENHSSDPAMYQEVRRGLHELGQFEDLVQDGHVRQGIAGLWCSEASDVWDDQRAPFDAAKRCLYIALRHQQLPLDIVVEGDDLKPYKILFVTDQHVSRAATKAIADWVKAGGRLIVTAGGGMFDEFNAPNTVMHTLLGCEQESLKESPGTPIQFEKQDLPFAIPLKHATFYTFEESLKMPAIGLISNLKGGVQDPALGMFGSGGAAVMGAQHGTGGAMVLAFLPGLSYFYPAIPRKPVDRGSTDDSMAHFIPTQFDPGTTGFLSYLTKDIARPVVCSERLVENTVIESPHGWLIPLVNWSAGPVKGLQVKVSLPVKGAKVSLASGAAVQAKTEDGQEVYQLDLDVADALILRK